MPESNPFQAHESELVKPNQGDWRIYKEGKFLELQEAIILSLDIEPNWFINKCAGKPMMVFNGLHRPEYNARLKTATNNVLGGADWAVKSINGAVEFQVVNLALFSAWAISNQWQVPEPFKALAEPVSTKPAPQSKADIWKDEAVKIADRLWSENTGEPYKQHRLCKLITKELNDRGFKNQRGDDLNLDTVIKEAIGSKLWWAKKGK